MASGARPPAAVALALAALLVASACADDGGGGGPDEAAFTAAMVDEFGATPEEATCIAGYVLEEYSPAEVATIQSEGIDALPLGRWDAYFHTVIACLNQGSADR